MSAADLALDHELGSANFLADPYPTYRRLRSEAPVHWSEKWDGWVLTRYDDVLAVLQDSQRFSNAGRQARLLSRLPPANRAALRPLEQHYAPGELSNLDPPDHTRLRALITKAFTPRVVEGLRDQIQSLVDRLLHAHQMAGAAAGGGLRARVESEHGFSGSQVSAGVFGLAAGQPAGT